MPTIQDVARRAGVGAATVSRVLSGNGYVKSETKERILQAIEELHYTPNEMARNLYYQKSGIVAVIVPELSHPFVAELVSAMEAALCAAGYQTMVCNTFYEQNYEQRYLDMLKQRRVDGIIFAAHTSLDVSQYQNLDRPIVGFDRVLGPDIPCVFADHKAGGRMAAEELLRCGCKNVVQFVGAYPWELDGADCEDEQMQPLLESKKWVLTPADQLHVVFQRIMNEHGAACHKMLDRYSFPAPGRVDEAVAGMFQTHPEIDGIFATDLLAMASLRYALEHGLRVPQDLKIVSYDGTTVTRFMTPSLTVIAQPVQALAEEAVRIIVRLIQGESVPEKRVTLPVVLRRGSTTEII